MLREARLRVEVHDDPFRPAAEDVDWLPEVARRGRVVLSKDQKILRRPLGRDFPADGPFRALGNGFVLPPRARGGESIPVRGFSARSGLPSARNPRDRSAVVAFLEEHTFPLVKGRHRTFLYRGEAEAAHAILPRPGPGPVFFGGLLLQSASFALSDIGVHTRGPLFDPVVDFVNEYRSEPLAVSDTVFVSCGVYESLLYGNRSMAPVLQRTEMDVRYVEARDGHNGESWRERLREGLSWLLPGPFSIGYP